MPFDEFLDSMRNTDLAKALELIAPRLDSELAQAIMKEAARRLRGEPEPHFAGPPLPDLPPLKAYAVPDDQEDISPNHQRRGGALPL